MRMEEVIQKLQLLSKRTDQITLYNGDIKSITKGIGRVVGKFDQELLDFLKLTNGATVFDYCFMGFKNSKLGVDIDKCMMELWASNNRLAGHFLPFMITSTSDNFGYLIDIVDDKGCHPIAYYSNVYDESVYVIGSSFKEFMKNFLKDVENTLNGSSEDILINVEKAGWPIDIDHWLANDQTLINNQKVIHETMKRHMRDTQFF